jgi:hypothetical protein
MDNSTRNRRDEQQVAQRNRSWRHCVSSVVHRRRFAAAVLTLDAVLAALLVIGVASPTPPGAPPATVECHSSGTGPVDNGEALMATGIAMNIPENGIIIALAAAIHETGMRNLANPNVPASLTVAHDGLAVDHQAVGILAQDPESDAPSELMSPAVAAEKFFTRMRGVSGWEAMPPQQVAGIVARSAFPDAYADDAPAAQQFYRGHLDEVRAQRCRHVEAQTAADLVGAHS